MQLNVWNDLAKAKRRWTEKKLRGLRAGCTSLGLSTRGSKKDCFEFFKTRELVEAQAVEAKLK